jgi:hypothetical protein
MQAFYVHPEHVRGTIFVLRQVAGTWVALAIPQHHYREYAGCFSLI